MKILILLVAFFVLSSAQNLGARLDQPNCMNKGQWMISPRDCFHMEIQSWDGNMVITRVTDHAVVWSTETAHRGGHVACMLNDGNFVLNNNAGTTIWQTYTGKSEGYHAFLQDDGQFTIRHPNGVTVWTSGRQMFC